MLIVAKLFAALLSIVVIARSIVDYKEKKESFQMTVFWIVVWLAITGIAFFPSLVDYAIGMFGGNKTGLGTVFGMGLVFVMFIAYRIYIKANRIEKNLNEISRKIALLSLDPSLPKRTYKKRPAPVKKIISSKKKSASAVASRASRRYPAKTVRG